MNYFGYIIDGKFSIEKVYGFLKHSLLQECDNIIPVRGPKNFKQGNFEYQNHVKKNSLEKFSGKEEIFFKEKIIFEALYHGGFIIGKE